VWRETVNEAGKRRSAALASQLRVEPPRRDPVRRKIQDGDGVAGKLPLRVGDDRPTHAYPRCVDWLGERAVAGLALLSTIVGMEWPGEYSLFTHAKIDLSDVPDGGAPDHLAFRVISTEMDYAFTRLAVEGPDFSGELDAFFRPTPVKQPTTMELSHAIQADEFKGCTALVVGGSRGLRIFRGRIVPRRGQAPCRRIYGRIQESSGPAEGEGLRRLSFRTADGDPVRTVRCDGPILHFPAHQQV
jgi:hypothetical protein